MSVEAGPVEGVRTVRGRVVLSRQVIDDGAVTIEGRRICWVGPADAIPAPWQSAPSVVAPAGGYVLPGLVDLHCHGGGGASFPDAGSLEEARVAVREHLRHGTTTMLASLVTAPAHTLLRQVALLASLAEGDEIAGIHLEGPFLSSARCGAQDPRALVAPDVALTEALLAAGRGHVRTMTLAPELPRAVGPASVAAALARAGAVPSWGHTDASPAEAARALDAWDRYAVADRLATVTHLFNGMRPWTHRDPGPVGELLVAARSTRLVVELVADGTHVDPAVVREVVALAGRDGVALVTDAMAAAGMPDGSYRLGGADVIVSGAVARLRQGGGIAGGTAHLLDVVRTTVAGGVGIVDAVHMASSVPARVLGLADRGSLEVGRRADLVVTDAGLRPVLVLRGGSVAPERSEDPRLPAGVLS